MKTIGEVLDSMQKVTDAKPDENTSAWNHAFENQGFAGIHWNVDPIPITEAEYNEAKAKLESE